MTTPNVARILADLRGEFVSRPLHVDDARALAAHIERLERDLLEARGELAALRIEQMADCQ